MKGSDTSMTNGASPGKRKKDTRRQDTIVSIVFLSVVVIGILFALLYSSGVLHNLAAASGDRKVDCRTGRVVTGVREYDPAEVTEQSGISVPGYEKLELKAGETKQTVYLNNPEENTCYFVLSLILEDKTVIWKSDYLEPGMAFDRIELNQPLEKGNYENVTLQYDCYSIADGRMLNGSAITVTLEVD